MYNNCIGYVLIIRSLTGHYLLDMNQSTTNSLLWDSTRNHETLLWFECTEQPQQPQRKKWFVQKLSTIEDVTKYCGIRINQYQSWIYIYRYHVFWNGTFPNTAHPYVCLVSIGVFSPCRKLSKRF